MRCIEFSKLSPDINQWVALEDMVNNVYLFNNSLYTGSFFCVLHVTYYLPFPYMAMG